MRADALRLPRGIRNNNPGNLRRTATAWRGERARHGDPDFEAFKTPQDGLRALARVLRTYYRARRLDSVGAIVARYAPAAENDTRAYARAVAAALGVGTDDRLNLDDPAVLRALMAAIVRHENGRRPDGADWYGAAELDAAVASAEA